jgi:phosphoribosylformimino-5-aminoimidazole carboxamide ribotide isomerase
VDVKVTNEARSATPSDDFELLPAIDLRGGRVVRLEQGSFDRETVFADDPTAVATEFRRAGAGWLHVVDLDGARTGRRVHDDVIREIVEAVSNGAAPVSVEVAGGLRDRASVDAAFAAGARRVVLGTAALNDAGLVADLAARHGSDRIAVALDVRDEHAVGDGWVPGAAGVPVPDVLDRLREAGVGTFVVTSIARDGLLGGPDLALLATTIAAADGGRIIASGGIATIDDVRAVRALGCAGAIVGRALYDGRISLADAIVATST